MPLIVDHDARRRALGETALRLVREEGPDALSVRRLAAASGWSSGAVRHYVPDVGQLARLLLDLVSERVQARVRRVLRDGVPTDRSQALVAACLEQVLPLDDERRVEFAVWRHFWGRDREGAEAAWVWEGQRMFHRQMTLLLAGVPDTEVSALPGRLRPDQERWAAHLHAFVDGLALLSAVAVPQPSAEEMRAELRHFVGIVAREVG